jgi:xylitol oxidase
MSPCYKQDSITIHFTWKPEWPEVQKLLPLIEKELLPFGVKPHWGKLFTMSPTKLEELYPKLPKFRQLVKEYDPAGKFQNHFLSKNLFNR